MRFCFQKLLLIPVVLAMILVATAQENRSPDMGPTTGLLSSPGPTFVVPANEIPKSWTIITYGDMRFTDPANTTATHPLARRALVAKIAEEHPDAVLLSGDVPLSGAVANDYAVYQNETAAWRDAKLRIYPALGNHELAGDATKGIQNWWAAFPELKGRRWYSVEFGNAYFIALDTDLPFATGSEQLNWLDGQLSNLPKHTKFVFLSLHHPLMGDDGPKAVHNVRPNEKLLKAYLESKVSQSSAPGANKHSAKLKARLIVVAGHVHNYARFASGGVTYLVSGGGGAKPYEVQRTPDDLYKGTEFPNYHYVKFTYDGKRLKATMYRLADPGADKLEWDPKDTFTIEEGK